MSSRRGSPRRGAYPGLVRVTLPPSRSPESRAAHRATARTPSGVRRRLFFDSEHGGPDGSREAARAWRATELAAAAVPDPPTRRIVLKPRSASGIVGVCRVVRASGTPIWEASYGSSAGERSVRSFSEGKYGEDGARQRAVQQRREWERADLGTVIPSNIPQESAP